MKLKYILLLPLTFLLLSCSKTEELDNYYITYTVTRQEGEDLISDVKYLNLSEKKEKNILEIPYTSQYPLMSYDKRHEKVFYSAKVHQADQIFEYDTHTKKHAQITDSLYGTNYIIPFDSSLFITAVSLDSSVFVLHPYVYKNEVLSDVSWDDDFEAFAVSYNPDLLEFLISGYSEKEDQKRIENQENTPYIAPINTIYSMNEEDQIKKLYEHDEGIINSIAGNEKYICFISDSDYRTKIIDRKTGKLAKEIETKAGSRVFYASPNDILYCYTKNELYTYDMNTDKVTTLYMKEFADSAINNALMLKEE